MALKYTIKLTHYAFDNTYTNARLFDSKANRDTYFNNLVGYTYSEKVNFNARDILRTNIILKVEPNAPLFSLLNYNYCVVKSDSETLYFYAKVSYQESGGLIRVDLENDIWQNYWYDIEFSDCMISRAHIDRFIEDTDDPTKVIFDCGKNSALFEREDIKNVAKRLVNRQRLMLHQDLADNSPLNEWLYNNVIAWCYISCRIGTYNTSVGGATNDELTYTGVKKQSELNQQINYGNGTFCYAILKNGSKMYVKDRNDSTHEISVSALPFFLGYNNGFADVYSIKLSIKPPFDLKTYNASEYTISGNTLTINTNNTFSDTHLTMSVGNHQNYWQFGVGGFLQLQYDDPTPIKATLVDNTILPTLKFAKTDIIGADKNYIFNPKINNADYKEMRITFAGDGEIYDLQKLNDTNPQFEYYEMLTSDVTKGLLQYKPLDNSGVYSTAYGDSFNGLMFTNDLSLPFSVSQYNEYFANNKNAYLSFQNQQAQARSNAVVNGLGGLLTGAAKFAMTGGTDVSGLMAGATGGIMGIMQTLNNQYYERAQFDMSIDNMKSAPEKQQNVNGNALLINAISPLGIYVEIYEALTNEQKIANDIAYDNGYIFNQYGNIKDYVNTRKYFNYIQANPTNIIANISNDAKMIMRQILANGIKLWHTDTIILNKENYEKWLEE